MIPHNLLGACLVVNRSHHDLVDPTDAIVRVGDCDSDLAIVGFQILVEPQMYTKKGPQSS